MSASICIFGEVLFDIFPDGHRVLGGAPFNVAWHLQAFGQNPRFISRVGADEEGQSIRSAMRRWGMQDHNLQVDEHLPTGRVDIELKHGEPSYDIVAPSAWDNIKLPDEPVDSCTLLYHGSLALRDPNSAQTLQQLVDHGRPATVFLDVNLRDPWWQQQAVCDMIEQADWVKLNQAEFDVLYPGHSDTRERMQAFIKEFNLVGLILTHGAAGAEVLTATQTHATVSPEKAQQVVDSVGAGDAFCAVLILGLVRQWPLTLMLQRAQAFASAMVAQRGATVSDELFYITIMAAWHDHDHG